MSERPPKPGFGKLYSLLQVVIVAALFFAALVFLGTAYNFLKGAQCLLPSEARLNFFQADGVCPSGP